MSVMRLGLVAGCAALCVALPGNSSGQLRPQPPAPIWRAATAKDARYADQHAFISEDGTEIIVRYRADPDPRLRKALGLPPAPERIVRARIRNWLVPEITARVSLGQGGRYLYEYDVRNRSTARDSIAFWDLSIPDGIDEPTIQGRWRRPSVSWPLRPQVLTPGAPLGRFLSWFADPPDRLISPGTVAAGFLLDSLYRPGFAVATFSDHASRVTDWPEIEEPWPDDVDNELDPLLRWVLERNKVLTIGPVFRQDDTPGTIASELAFSLDQLDKMGELDSASPFISEVRSLLGEIARSGQVAEISLHTRPSTGHEMDLARILALSLRISLPSGISPVRSASHR